MSIAYNFMFVKHFLMINIKKLIKYIGGLFMNKVLCLYAKDSAAVEHTYNVLCEGAEEILYPIGQCDRNDCMADVVDRFGTRLYIALKKVLL